jgi:protoporphyrinogen oxidase
MAVNFINRRQFLITAGSVITVAGLYKYWSVKKPPVSGKFIGASSDLGHRLRDGYFPKATQTLNKTLVIIGGGIAGLSAAWKLHKSGFTDFILLELENQVGGNSQSGENAVSAYPWGAHYVPLLSEESTSASELFEDLGIITAYQQNIPVYNDYYLSADPHERLYIYGRWQEGLVPQIGTHETDQLQYKSFFAEMEKFKQLKGNDGRKIFAIPVDKSSTDPVWRKLDTISMAEYMDQNNWHSEYLRWYINYCCRDDYGASIDKVSAWAGIHYFAARTGKAANADSGTVITWSEGNGWLVKQLKNQLKDYLKTNAVAIKIERDNTNNKIHYYDVVQDKTIIIESKAVIIATPRFIAERLLPTNINLQVFHYSPWLVANITLNKLPEGRGVSLSWDNMIYGSQFLGYIVATHQNLNRVQSETVLTYYFPVSQLPEKQARQWLLEQSYEQLRDILLKELLLIHPELDAHIKKLDICLWGHGMICPTPNFIWGNERKQAVKQAAPVFYAHSDMSGISIFEEANYQGVNAAESAMKYLKHDFSSSL